MRLFDGLGHKDLIAWHKQLAKLTESVRSESFCSTLCETLEQVVSFRQVAIITYKSHHQPIAIHDTYSLSDHKWVIERYLDGSYVLDPFYTSLRSGIAPGVHRLKELAPDSFEESDYYQQFYGTLRHMDDEAGIFIDLPDGVFMIISLALNTDLDALKRSDRNVLNSIYPLLRALVREFWSRQAIKFTSKSSDQDPVEKAFQTFGSGTLTERELEIISMILQGHSSKSVANTLGIAPGTVKVHRKNIYTRLNISTQSQLFSLFLDHLAVEAASQS